MSRPLISVVMPTRLRPHVLPRAVASVFNQTFRDFELVVVDDNPEAQQGETRRALAAWARDQRLIYLPHETPRNAAAARNFGLDHAQGDWVTYLDDDDAYAQPKIEEQWKCAQTTASPLVLCGSRYFLGRRRRVRHCDRTAYSGAELLLEAQSGSPFLFHQRNARVRFDEALSAGEDLDYFLRLVEYFGLSQVPNVPAPLVEVYPQPGDGRVNVQAPFLRAAQRLVCLRRAPRYGREATRHAVARAELLRCRWRPTPLATQLRASRRLLAVGGVCEWRLVLNSLLLRVPAFRRLLVT